MGNKVPVKSMLLLGVALLLSVSFIIISSREEEDKDYVFSDNSLFIQSYPVDEKGRENYLFIGNDSFLARGSIVRSGQILGMEKSTERNRIISYQTERGDTVSSIASKFEISENTVRWANSITGNSVKEGEELLILPTTGVLYYVRTGDSVSTIAQIHKAKSEDIINFNNIDDETQIKPGDQLIIPNGEKPREIIPQRPPSTNQVGFAAVTFGTVTQGAHPGHANAVDIANNCGTPIYSGSSGVVTGTGHDYGRAGNYIWIDHGNFSALYAHLQTINVSSGQRVTQGQQIATMGNTGYTRGVTGCHLHFETRGSANPFSHMQRGQYMQ